MHRHSLAVLAVMWAHYYDGDSLMRSRTAVRSVEIFVRLRLEEAEQSSSREEARAALEAALAEMRHLASSPLAADALKGLEAEVAKSRATLGARGWL